MLHLSLFEIKLAIESDDASNAVTRPGLLKKITKLRDAVEVPQDSLLRLCAQPLQNASLRVAVELGLPEIISTASGPNHEMGVSLKQLAAESHGDPNLIARLMRVLTASGVFVEVGFQRYMSNPLNEVIVQQGYNAGVKVLFDVELPTILNLVPCSRKHEFQSPANTSQSAFDYTFGSSFFDWMKENPAILRSYDLYMAGRRVGKPSWLDFYPIEERLLQGTSLENAILMVDIGGGQGHELKSLSNKYGDKGLPGQLILQDMVAPNREVCDSAFEYMVHNFFEPQPVKGARVYHLRSILHDWPTPTCRIILSRIADAMTPNYSKLIIREFILPDTDVPLYAACTDVRMMLLHAGMERTESQWKELLSDVGLELEGFWTMERGGEGVIEAVKRPECPN
ncbi:S-adenosyl-L-methionine-dependent methyltransferase [Usnea florida]